MVVRLGDGGDIPFWHGAWTGTASLAELFPRLFNLSNKKDGSVKDMGEWINGRWVWTVGWRRELFDRVLGREKEMLEFIKKYSPTIGAADRWTWVEERSRLFSVKEAYNLLCTSGSNAAPNRPPTECLRLVWKARAIHKAKITAWRLLWNRLPTADNLRKRIALSDEECRCGGCRLTVESAVHGFLVCERATQVWNGVFAWVGVSWAAPHTITEHLLCFSSLCDGKRWSRKLSGLWICTIWVLWRWRNEVLFGGKEWSLCRIMEEIKCRFWSWCTSWGEADACMSFNVWANKTLVEQWSNV